MLSNIMREFGKVALFREDLTAELCLRHFAIEMGWNGPFELGGVVFVVGSTSEGIKGLREIYFYFDDVVVVALLLYWDFRLAMIGYVVIEDVRETTCSSRDQYDRPHGDT